MGVYMHSFALTPPYPLLKYRGKLMKPRHSIYYTSHAQDHTYPRSRKNHVTDSYFDSRKSQVGTRIPTTSPLFSSSYPSCSTMVGKSNPTVPYTTPHPATPRHTRSHASNESEICCTDFRLPLCEVLRLRLLLPPPPPSSAVLWQGNQPPSFHIPHRPQTHKIARIKGVVGIFLFYRLPTPIKSRQLQLLDPDATPQISAIMFVGHLSSWNWRCFRQIFRHFSWSATGRPFPNTHRLPFTPTGPL